VRSVAYTSLPAHTRVSAAFSGASAASVLTESEIRPAVQDGATAIDLLFRLPAS
jgi:hypothetical protein